MLIFNAIGRVAALFILAAASDSTGTGRITGRIRGLPHLCGDENTMVWAVTSDCKRSYRATDIQGDRFVFTSIPPGAYKLVAYCFPAYPRPTPEFRVETDRTAETDVEMELLSVDGGDGNFKGLTPLNGRIVDAGGHPVDGATVTNSVNNDESVTGSDGRFGFCALPPEKIGLAVRHPAYRARTVKLKLGIFNYSYGQLEIKLDKKR